MPDFSLGKRNRDDFHEPAAHPPLSPTRQRYCHLHSPGAQDVQILGMSREERDYDDDDDDDDDDDRGLRPTGHRHLHHDYR